MANESGSRAATSGLLRVSSQNSLKIVQHPEAVGRRGGWARNGATARRADFTNCRCCCVCGLVDDVLEQLLDGRGPGSRGARSRVL